MRHILPDLAERSIAHVAEGMMLRELIRMHIAERIDLTERDARAVAAVRPDEPADLLGAGVVALRERLDIHIDPIAVVVDGQNLLFESALFKILCPRDNRIHRAARLLRRHVLIHHLTAAPGVNEMIEADAVDALFLDEVKDFIELHDVVVVDGKAQPHALPDRDAVLDALHRAPVRALDAAEHIVHIREPVERDTDVADAEILDALRDLACDERPVRRERRTHPAVARILRQLEKIRTDQRLAARKEQYGHAKIRKLVDEAFCLLRRELSRVFLPVRFHIAVAAAQIAGARRVPDDDGSHALRRAVPHAVRVMPVAQRIAVVLVHKK